MLYVLFYFFKQKTAFEMRISDWSSYVCSSDLGPLVEADIIGFVCIDLAHCPGLAGLAGQNRLDSSIIVKRSSDDEAVALGAQAHRNRLGGGLDQVVRVADHDAVDLHRALVELAPRLLVRAREAEFAQRVEDAKPLRRRRDLRQVAADLPFFKGFRGRSEEDTSALQSLMRISFAVF